jgi:hypothetical protein
MFRPALCRRSLLRFLTAAVAASACPVAARADTVYFTSFFSGGLYRYDSANPGAQPQSLLGAETIIPGASGLAIGPDGNLYIGQTQSLFVGGGTNAIMRYNLTTGSLSTVTTFSGTGVSPGSIAFRGSEMLVGRNPVGVYNTGPVVKLTGWDGNGDVTLTDFTPPGAITASSPGIAVAADGTVYVSDQNYVFGGTATGPVRWFAPGGSNGILIPSGSSGLSGPTGLLLSGSTLFTASVENGNVLQTNLGTLTTGSFAVPALGTNSVGVLSLLSDGSLLVGNPGQGSIYRLGTDGVVTGTFSTNTGGIGGIAVVPEPSLLAVGLGGAGCMAGWLRLRRRRSAGRR